MAVNIRQRFTTIRQAQAHRLRLPRYVWLDGFRYVIVAAVLLALMSLLTLGQTGIMATKGYQITQLEHARDELIRNRSSMQIELAEAQTIEKLKKRAIDQGLKPVEFDQVRYLDVQPLHAPASPAAPAPTAAATPDQPQP